MAKKVFKVIGIVVASIILFVGAVFGVMALMGKFRTPDVYPDRLQFLENEQTIVYREEDSERIYSFVLNGFSDDQDYEVNQKDCYIYFVNNTGADLITLCDRNGEALTSENNRYSIECNEYVYYRIKPVSESNFSQDTYGKVVLQARDSRSQVQSNVLTIWIDREVSDLRLDYADSSTFEGEQELTIGVGVSLDFVYDADPIHSLNPISRESEGKIVELYYDDPNEADYVPINQDTYSRYPFINYDSDTQEYTFLSDTAGIYEFKIAVFATYQERVDYLNSDYAQTDSYFERISNMVNTTLILNVVNSDISSVGMSLSGVGLNLYSDNNYITLSGESGVEGANDNNLGLYMIQNGSATTARFNEVDFNLHQEDNWLYEDIVFTSDDETKTIRFNQNSASITGFGAYDNTYSISFTTNSNIINLIDNSTGMIVLRLNYTLGNILPEVNTTIIDSIGCEYETETINFTCSTGASFLQDNYDGTYTIKALRSGSYLEFYIYDTQTMQYSRAYVFDYSVTSLGSGETKSWNIIAKNALELSDTQNLVLGILVVNNNGGAHFASSGVTINPVELTFGFVSENQTHNLQVGYERDQNQNYQVIYPELDFKDIVTITNGSYDACVFVTPKIADENAEVYDIDVIEGMTFVDALGNEYVLVGYIEADHYVNKVRVRSGAVNSNTPIYMIQLRNQYNQTADEYIQAIFENEQNNIILRYSILMQDAEGVTATKYVDITMFNKELTASLSDNSATVDNIAVVNGDLVVTINAEEYICTFESVSRNGADVCLYNRQNQDAEMVADIVNSYITDDRSVTINVSYTLLSNEIVFNYNPGSVNNVPSPEGGDTFVNIVDGDVFIVENTASHTLTLTSNVPNMLRDIYNAGGFTLENIHIYMYNASGSIISQNSNALEIQNLEYVADSLVVTYNSASALSNTDSYLKIVLEYNGEQIVTDSKIYIESTIATDIQFKYIDENDLVNTVTLSQTPDDALNSTFYIEVEISYNVNANAGLGGYEYRYFIVNNSDSSNPVRKEIHALELSQKLFNVSTNGEISEGFQVLPAITGIDKSISYSSNSPSIIDFSPDTYNLIVNKIGKAVAQVNCDDITRYFAISVMTEQSNGDSNFTLSDLSGGLGEDYTEELSVSLSDFISYSYNDNGSEMVLKTNAQFVSIENVEVVQFGGDSELEVVIDSNNNIYIMVVQDTPEGEEGDEGTDEDGTIDNSLVVLAIESDENSWKFTRVNYLYAGLVIRFDINIKTNETITYELTFSSSVEININLDWENFYQGTTVLLYEESETGTTSNNPIFRIKNSISEGVGITCQVYINDSEMPNLIENQEFTFSEVGTYRFSFLHNNSELSSYTINVSPNVIALINSSEFNGGDTYNYSDFVSLKSFKTGVVYGLNSVGVYPETVDYLDDVSDYTNLTLNLMQGTSITIGDNSTFTVGWIENIGEEFNEDIRVSFNYAVGNTNRSVDLVETQITLKNKYVISRETQGDQYPEYIDQTYNLMSNINYNTFVGILDNPQFTLSSIQSNISNLDFNVATGGIFRLTTNLSSSQDNVVLTFTFVDDEGRRLIYTSSLNADDYSIDLVPLSPDEIDSIAYSGTTSSNAFDLLNDLYDLDGLLAKLGADRGIISSVLVSGVSDPTVFADTTFIGSGYLGNQNYGAYAVINEIDGNSRTVSITYVITYNDGVEYEFTRELLIRNRQYITITTPFVDSTLTGTTTSYVFVGDDGSTDAENLLGVYQDENTYSITIQNINNIDYYFEPVNIGQTINFRYDEIQSVGRVNIFNSQDASIDPNADFSIELIARQNNANTLNYFNNNQIIIDNENKTVRFNQHSSFGSNTYGYFIFKLTSESGAVAYYFVYLYNQTNTSYNNVDYTNTHIVNSNIDTQTPNNFLNAENATFLGLSINQEFFNTNYNASINYSNVDFYLLDAEMLDGNFYDLSGGEYNRYSKLDDQEIPEILNYTYLKIGLLFNSGTVKFYIGALEVYVLPLYEETVTGDVSQMISGIDSGEYTKTLNTDVDSYEIPFANVNNRFNNDDFAGNWSAEIEAKDDSFDYTSNSISSNGVSIVTLNGTSVVLNSYVNNQDLQFTVRYIYSVGVNTFVVKVHYTYEQIDINTTPATVTVGTFILNNEDQNGAVNSYFNNLLDLSTIIGNYKKEITILYAVEECAKINLSDATVDKVGDIITFNNGCGMRYVYQENKHYLEFDQTIADYSEQFVIRFDDILDADNSVYTKTITVNVASGLYYNQPNSGVGNSENNPLNSTLNSNQLYQNITGSQITINSSSNSTTGVTRYYVGGLNIYTNVASTLEISFSDSKYISGLTGEMMTIDNTGNINFTHTAEDKLLTLRISVKSGDDYYLISSGEPLELNFYVNAIRTYAGIVATYYTDGANHENVVSGYVIRDIYSELFTDIAEYDQNIVDIVNSSKIINEKRIALIDLEGNYVLDYTASAIGFTDSSNPNYINFSVGENIVYSNENRQMTFSNVTTNTLANLYLSNDSGVNSTIYSYQIMSSSEYRDGLDYQVYTNGTMDNKEYVALLIEDESSSNPFVYGETTTENGQTVLLGNHVATLMDGNNSVFYITDLNIYLNDSRVTTYNVAKLDRVESSEYPDDIVYIISNINNTNMSVTIRLGTGRRLYVGLERNSGDPFRTLSIEMSIYGDSGNLISIYDTDSFTTKTFEIKFYNYTLESDYTTSYDSIYATNYIDLSDKISIKSNIESVDGENAYISLSNADLVTGNSEGASYYIISGNKHYITDINNNIFDYYKSTSDTQMNLIMTKAVGVNISVCLIFKVSDEEGYFIGDIQYNFLLRPNFEFRVNDGTLTSGDDEFYTDYLLTSDKLGNTPTFHYVEDLSDANAEQNVQIEIDDVVYNTNLKLELYTADGTNQKITDIRSSLTITETSSWGDRYINIDDFVLTLSKDLSGLLMLRLDINLGANGTYTVYWNINILGFVSLQYKSPILGENNILSHSNGEAFSSGTEVAIISTTSNDQTGILMSNTEGTLNQNPSIANNFTITSITGRYVIVPFTESIDADEAFDSAGNNFDAGLNYNTYILSNNTVSVVLPSVAQSSGPNYEYYNVIYRIAYTYLNQTTDYYYVTYKVYNSASVNVNTNFTIVDVDTDTVDDQLDLFYYAETYVGTSNNENTVTLHLNSNKDIVAEVRLTGAYSGYNGTYTRVANSTTDYSNGINTIRISLSNNIYTISVLSSEISLTANRTVITRSTYYNQSEIVNGSIFNSEYSSIDDFKTFISSIDSIRLSNMTGFTGSNTAIYYALEYLNVSNSGVFGIKLDEPKTDSSLGTSYNEKLFNNELIADLDVIASGNSIIHIEKYDDNSNLGFKLTTSNAITPKGQFRVRDIFLPTQCSSTSFLDYVVVGVYSTSASSNWVNNASSVSVINNNVGTINVNGTDYILCQLRFSGSSDSLYNLVTTNYYAIYTSSGNIVTVDYGTNIQSYFFQVNYTNSDSVLDLYGKFATYQNSSDGTLTKTPYSSGSATLNSVLETDTEYSAISYDAGRYRYITVTKETLRLYKNSHPTATALSLNYSATYNGKSLTFRVDFQLPEYPFVENTMSGTDDITVNLLSNGLMVYDTNGILVELTNENINMVSSIIENGTNYIREIVSNNSDYTGEIILNGQLVNQYFTNNPSASQLSIRLTLTTGTMLETQRDLQFNIVITK